DSPGTETDLRYIDSALSEFSVIHPETITSSRRLAKTVNEPVSRPSRKMNAGPNNGYSVLQ
ncbi:MAG TPA: hypothetical protein PKC98_26420, partial [Candidatus Melainabacteria bacterium]|nr:hypothetical protein [Candidatus Melainabacteria bacterium]